MKLEKETRTMLLFMLMFSPLCSPHKLSSVRAECRISVRGFFFWILIVFTDEQQNPHHRVWTTSLVDTWADPFAAQSLDLQLIRTSTNSPPIKLSFKFIDFWFWNELNRDEITTFYLMFSICTSFYWLSFFFPHIADWSRLASHKSPPRPSLLPTPTHCVCLFLYAAHQQQHTPKNKLFYY